MLTKRNHSVKRKRILDLLRESTEHPTADWIYARLKKEFPDLSLGTVYRNLRILAEEGHILSIQAGSTYDRFDADLSEHQHLICECCGRVLDIRLEMEETILRRLEEQTGFTIASPRLSMTGICPECQEKEK